MTKAPKTPKKTKTVDNAAIIRRGYCTTEEWYLMEASGKLEKINLRAKDGFTEGIWVYALESSDKAGEKFHFVFFNNPIIFMGAPRAIGGLVGIAKATGAETRGEADSCECKILFIKAGREAIDYWHESVKAAVKTN
jgi:hypothetical protein